jgi:hypothetical protein
MGPLFPGVAPDAPDDFERDILAPIAAVPDGYTPPAPGEEVPAPAAPSGMFSEYLEQQGIPSAPQGSAPPTGLVPQPGQSGSVGASSGSSAGGSVSSSFSGLPGGRARADEIVGDANVIADGQVADYKQKAADYQAGVEKNFGDIKSANDEEARIRAEQAEEQAQYHREHQDFLQANIDAQKLNLALRQKRAAEVEADVKTQLAGVRALMVQDANPLRTLETAEKLGLGMAAFAQGFLKAGYGIDIDVTGQINTWVNRSLQEHQQKIQNARTGVQDTLSLWEVARQSSQDEQEALQRFRAMSTEALKAAVEANAMKFASPLALVEAKKLNARLDLEQHTTVMGIADKVAEREYKIRDQALEAVKTRGLLEHQKRQDGVAWRQAKTEADRVALANRQFDEKVKADAADAARDAQTEILVDPTDNTVIGDVNFKEAKEFGTTQKILDGKKALASFDTIKKSVKRLQTAVGYRDDTLGFTAWLKKQGSDVEREYNRQVTLTVLPYVKNIAATTFTDKFVATARSLLEPDTLLDRTEEETSRAILQFEQAARDSAQEVITELNGTRGVRFRSPDKREKGPELPKIDPSGAADFEIGTTHEKAVEDLGTRLLSWAFIGSANVDGEPFAERKIAASSTWNHAWGGEDTHMPAGAKTIEFLALASVNPAAARKQGLDPAIRDRERLTAERLTGKDALSDDALRMAARAALEKAAALDGGYRKYDEKTGAYAYKILKELRALEAKQKGN